MACKKYLIFILLILSFCGTGSLIGRSYVSAVISGTFSGVLIGYIIVVTASIVESKCVQVHDSRSKQRLQKDIRIIFGPLT